MTVTNAWLIKCDDAVSIAVAEHEIVEYVQHPIMQSATGNVLVTQQMELRGEYVPIVDLPLIMELSPAAQSQAVCIIAYQLFAGEKLKQLALSTLSAPSKIRIDDNQACELPGALSNNRLEKYILSCFENETGPVLIIDFASFCVGELNQQVAKN